MRSELHKLITECVKLIAEEYLSFGIYLNQRDRTELFDEIKNDLISGRVGETDLKEFLK